MQPYSDYEIAQRRITERQRKKTQFRASVIFAILALLATFLGHSIGYCSIPVAVLAGLFAISNGIDLYYTAPTRPPDALELEQEMEWLFGEDWSYISTSQAYAFAQDRIRKRRINKWRFLGHAIIFVPINGLITLSALTAPYLDNYFFAIVALVWLGLFIAHALTAFPRQKWLARKEIAYGQTIQLELASFQPEKAKFKEKLKRGKYYEVGDDGELVEVEDEIMQLEDKPKREVDNQ